ncbi:MAG: lytic transglycosylase domain-containing protein [Vulcanimicrobiaceae bacterium]
MTIHMLALAALIQHCAPAIAPSTMAAIVHVESGDNPLAIGDNTTGRSYYPYDRATAERLARRLLAAGHLLDLGIAQIDSINFAGFGVTAHTVFDPCVNLSIGARILSGDYIFAAQRYGDGQAALRHAIGMYNTGRLNGGARYVARVLAAAGIQEENVSSPKVIARHDAMRSPILVHVAIAQRRRPTPRRKVVSPSRSPILVTLARTTLPKIF